MQPKPVEATQPEPERERDYSARIHGAISSYSNSILSIGELFRDGQKGVRFPKDLIKALEQKLQDIAMGKDPACVPDLHLSSADLPYGRVYIPRECRMRSGPHSASLHGRYRA